MLENFDLNSIVLLMGISGLVPLILAWKASQLGKSEEIRYFIYLLVSCAAYSVFYACELSASTLPVKVLFLKLQYFGAVFFGPCMFLFTLNYSNRETAINPRLLKMIFILPLLSLLMVLSNDLHFLFYASYRLVDYGIFEVLVTEKRFFYWFHQVYTLLFLILSQRYIINMIKNGTASGTKQVKLIWFGMSFPVIAYAIYLTGTVPMNLDPIPISFIGTGLFVFLGLTKYQLFKETPIIYKTLFESLSDGALVCDTEGNLVFCNPAAARILKLAKSNQKFHPNLTTQVAWNKLKGVLEKSDEKGITIFKWDENEEYRWYSASKSPINNSKGKFLGEIVVLRDVTSEKDYQRKLELAKEEADKANKAKSEFLANMSHEIRTPLNGVIGFTELLNNTPLSNQQKRYVSTAYNSANTLLELINNVLDLSKIEAGKFELDYQDINLQMLYRTISDVMSFHANKSGIEFLINYPANVPILVRSDELKIKQILINLLNNALKFTKEGEVELSVEVMDRLPDKKVLLRFQVRDTGIGIDPKKQELIFEAFSQADSSTTKQYGGTGLGLTISNKLLSLMGSRLQVESVLDEGSIFYFDLEVDDLNAPKPRQLPFEELSTAVLIGCSPMLINSAKLYLDQLGYEIRSCDELTDAKEMLQRVSGVKCILINQQLSEKEKNFTDLRDFMVWGKTINLPPCLMLLPADVPENTLTKFTSIGYSNVLIKPMMLDNLTEALDKISSLALKEESEVIPKDKELSYYHFKVLVAEDNAVNRMLVRVYLGNIFPGIKVLEANNGKIALELFYSENPHLVLSDIQMPEMSGYDLVAAIREHPSGKDLGIIALTANAGNAEEEKCKAAGFNDFISKPVRQESFKEVVQKWVKKTP
ncbi:histidine kinase N-terminal 7TM domain-containing protein [Lunatibacter salilacus]|uniref:histidine kinase N-terminal 7TM domain-containing protein n=1 Tax=Lunatibacter salilacus TaxID=2483804 RepID=UPI00131AC98B|nr:histidine kinase N-terminal 7TM domain-containing protein [Lunatibacter salilacus]